MNTSEIQKVLLGDTSLENFCLLYKDAKQRLFTRNDGAAISAEFGLVFDTEGFVVTSSQIHNILESSSNNNIYFFANLIILSAFNYDNENTEDIVVSLSE